MSASQAATFEARVRKSQHEDSIIAPPKGSEYATAAASEAANNKDDSAEDSKDEVEPFDTYLIDTYEGINWTRLRKY